MTELDNWAGAEMLLSDNSLLACQQTVRYVPGNRLVCKASWQQQQVYAKIFIGERGEHRAMREKSGWQLLSKAGILTPALLHEALLADGTGRVLIYAAIDVAGSAEDEWHALATDAMGRLALMRALTQAVASHHQAGLLQTDLYLKNFLTQGENIYTLDCDGIRRLGSLCGRRQALHNLATLFSKMDVADELWIPDLYREYCGKRGWPESLSDNLWLQRLVPRLRRKMISTYADKKVFRSCSDVAVEKTPRRFLAVARAWVDLLQPETNEPDLWLDENRGHRLKSGNTCTLSVVGIGSKQVVVKRYNLKNFWHGLNRALRPSRAAACWANSHRLFMLGISCAAPVALLERRFGPFRRQAYFLAEYIAAPDVTEFFADTRMPAASKIGAAHRIASLFYKLHLLRIEHGDFKSTNMKMVDDKPLLLDLDSMRQRNCEWFFARRHARDLRRFMRNWQHDQATTGLLTAAFKNAYKDSAPLQRAGML